LAAMGLVPAGSYSNRDYCTDHVHVPATIDPLRLDLLADAQTSGGLLIFLPLSLAPSLLDILHAEGTLDAAIIGEVTQGDAGQIALR
jgi:selenide,water dikinase